MDNQDNHITANAAPATPEGFEAREVVWPGTEERFMALFPQRDGDCSFD